MMFVHIDSTILSVISNQHDDLEKAKGIVPFF